MDKKRNFKIIYILIFTAAVYFALYILFTNEGRELISVIGSAALLLIASYILFDKLIFKIDKDSDAENQNKDDGDAKAMLCFFEIEKAHKATYTILKKMSIRFEEHMSEQSEELKKLTTIMGQVRDDNKKTYDQARRIGIAVEQIQKNGNTLNEIEKSGHQAVVKYNKENAKQLMLNRNENIDKLLSEIGLVVEKLNEKPTNAINTDFKDVIDQYENLSSVMIDNTVTMSGRMEDISGTLKEYQKKMDGVLNDISNGDFKYVTQDASEYASKPDTGFFEEPLEEMDTGIPDELIEEPAAGILDGFIEEPTEGILDGFIEEPTEGILDGFIEEPTEGILDGFIEEPTVDNIIEDQVKINQDKIEQAKLWKAEQAKLRQTRIDESYLDSLLVEKSETEPETEHQQGDLGTEDFSSMFSTNNVKEPVETVVSAAPSIDLSDPNKQMSPDDIAALIASMTQ